MQLELYCPHVIRDLNLIKGANSKSEFICLFSHDREEEEEDNLIYFTCTNQTHFRI